MTRLKGTIWPPWVWPDSWRSTPYLAASMAWTGWWASRTVERERSRPPSARSKSGPSPEAAPVTSLTPARSSTAPACAISTRSLPQRADPEPAELLDPLLGPLAGVVLVVAGDEVGAVAGLEALQRPGQRAQLGHRAVDQIPTMATTSASSELIMRTIRSVCARARERAEVDVTDHGEPQAAEARIQSGQRDLDRLDHRVAQGGPDPRPDSGQRPHPGGGGSRTGDEKPAAHPVRSDRGDPVPAARHGRRARAA